MTESDREKLMKLHKTAQEALSHYHQCSIHKLVGASNKLDKAEAAFTRTLGGMK